VTTDNGHTKCAGPLADASYRIAAITSTNFVDTFWSWLCTCYKGLGEGEAAVETREIRAPVNTLVSNSVARMEIK
jgi:hypothetical protein